MHLPNTAILKHISQNLQPVESKMQSLKKLTQPSTTSPAVDETQEAPAKALNRWNIKPQPNEPETTSSNKNETQTNQTAKKPESKLNSRAKQQKHSNSGRSRLQNQNGYYYDNGYNANR